MAQDDDNPKQKIEGGDGSMNVQVGRDYHHHEAMKTSSIISPTQDEIDKYDPRIREIKDAVTYHVPSPTELKRLSQPSPMARFFRFLAGLSVMIFVFYLLWQLI